MNILHGALLVLVASVAHGQEPASENDYYTVDYLTPPDGEVLEVGGMDFMPDGRLAVSTRRGQVWLVANPLADDPAEARFELFAEGLWEGLGLAVVEGQIHVVQRGELSRLRDTDGDGVCDRIDTLADDWGLSGNYHEFAFGLPVDEAGNFYVSFNVAFFSPEWWHGKSPVPYRGWVLRVSPSGEVTPVCSGLRSPCGLGFDAGGELFATDNQGDWMASSPIFHVKEGAFYGHPASLDWTEEYRATQTFASDTTPPARANERTPPAVWIPYKWSRSTGNLVPDTTGGQFGPFADQLVVAELTNGLVLRAQLEKVRGEYQGACFLLRQGIGSVCRVKFAPDGTLFCGLTNRGWGGRPPADGIARVRWTGVTPMEMQRVHLIQDGFEVDFTLPVAEGVELTPESVLVTQYDYDYWWEYGSPERHTTVVAATETTLSQDRKRLTLRTRGLTPGMVARVVLYGVLGEGGVPLLHDEFAYTLNQLPEGPLATELVAKIVPPPPARESEEDGWLRLTYGDALDRWDAEGWIQCDAELDPDDPRTLATKPGVNALVNLGEGAPSHFVSKQVFGSAAVHVEFMLPEKGNSGVYLMGRYEVQLLDSSGVREPGPGDCGGIYRGATWPGSAPALNAFKGPGTWHELDIEFQAPRFDANGVKIENARLWSVTLDGTPVQENVELPEPTLGALSGEEVALGPLLLQGDHGPVAYGNIRVKPFQPPREGAGWVSIFNGEDLEGWRVSDDGYWSVEDGTIVGEGPRSHLFSPRGDYEDFEVRAEVKISDGGNSGLYFRTTFGPEWPAGYEAQVNSSFADPQKTGSLYGLAPVTTHLIPPNTWFDYHVTCRDEEGGTRVVIRVNGVVITDTLDGERRHAAGHIALQQHHEGSVVEFRAIEVREL